MTLPPFTLYGDAISGNCLKIKWLAQALDLPFTWQSIDIVDGESRTDEFLSINPFGQVPVVKFDDGTVLTQSNAIIQYLDSLAGDRFTPQEPLAKARVSEWLFWEQYSHEPAIAVRRFRHRVLNQLVGDRDTELAERGARALAHMDRHLAVQKTNGLEYFVGRAPSIADLALVAYTRVADEGGFDLLDYPEVHAWVRRIEAAFSIPPEEGRF
ncbi:MAG: glutathione S-transferase family protein [Pseudomonadota bacterium]